ncbi:SDR family NAD(P)-dependent oxidoreductase [Neisseria sp. S1]|uniref:SDR family NAD(P)-dependent oxidoreductase n=1 Tax=Neisseria sp. S1 TaxID=3318354 RepID=UPI003A8B6B09
MTQKVIISGHSSGLGKALATYYAEKGAAVLGIARRKSADLMENIQQISLDLSDTAALQNFCQQPVLAEFTANASEVILINNAATVLPNALLGRQNDMEIAAAVGLNITAPLILSNMMIRATNGRALKIIHISSGAGRKPYPGWSVYGATKAALDHHALCVAAEQHENVRIASIAPGVVDTDMQAQIRSADESSFPMRPYFEALKTEGSLVGPRQTVERIAAMIEDKDFGRYVLADVRDYCSINK